MAPDNISLDTVRQNLYKSGKMCFSVTAKNPHPHGCGFFIACEG